MGEAERIWSPQVQTVDAPTSRQWREASAPARTAEVWNASAFASAVQGTPSALARVKLDHFEMVRELHGIIAAEEAVQLVGALLASVFRASDVLAPWGDDGFVVIFPNTAGPGAVRAVEKGLQAIRGEHFLLPGGRVQSLTASAGVVEKTENGAVYLLDELINEAEELVAVAQGAGGGRIHWAAGEVIPAEATILLLDDDPVSAGVIRHRMERKSHRVIHFPDGSEAMEQLGNEAISLIILNLNMGGIGGVGSIARIRQVPQLRKVPIVVLSKVESESDIVRCFQMGANDYLQAPFSVTELTSRVQRLLRSR